jgi:hypothetical protein
MESVMAWGIDCVRVTKLVTVNVDVRKLVMEGISVVVEKGPVGLAVLLGMKEVLGTTGVDVDTG